MRAYACVRVSVCARENIHRHRWETYAYTNAVYFDAVYIHPESIRAKQPRAAIDSISYTVLVKIY